MSDRAAIFRLNEYLRNTGGVRNTDVLRLGLQIPPEDYAVLKWINPALNSRDYQERTDAWLAFMRDPASMPYRVRQKI